jgi:hypothetical protein
MKLDEINLIPEPIEYKIRNNLGENLVVKGTPFGRYFALRLCNNNYVVDHWPSGFKAGDFSPINMAVLFATFLSEIDDFSDSDIISKKSIESYKRYKHQFDYYKEFDNKSNTFYEGEPGLNPSNIKELL